MSNLLTIKKDDVYISTNIIAKELDRQHRVITNLVRNYKEELESLGVITLQNVPNKEDYGKPIQAYYLNEEQFVFLVMNMRTKSGELDKVMKLKLTISKQFHQMRQWILEQKTQKQNQQYIETRNQSKIGRKQETDIIKEFIKYAKEQGSKNADKYYMIISKMENSAFFILKEKFKNVREVLNITQLSKIIIADLIVKNAIIEGMEQQMFYKDIFQLAKKRVVEMSNSLGIRDVLPNANLNQLN